MRKKSAFFLPTILLLFLTVVAHAQETGVIVQTRLRGVQELYWHDTLDSSLLSVASIAQVRRPDSESPTPAQLEAAVDVQPNPNNPNRIVARWRITLLKENQVIQEGTIQGLIPRERDLADYFWIPLLEAMEGAVSSVEPEPLDGFVILGLPGTSIDLGIDELLTISDGGQLWAPGTIPSTYELRAHLSGYYSETLAVGIQRSGEVVQIEQQKLPRFIFDVSLYMLQFPEISFGVRLGSRAFVKLTFQQFLAGIYLNSNNSGGDYSPATESPSPFLSIPLLQPGLLLGSYLSAPEQAFRLYGGLGAFLRIVTAPEIIGILDPLSPWGLSGVIGAEYSRRRQIGIFGELGVNSYFPTNPEAFAYGASLESNKNEMPGLGTILGPAVIEFPVGRIGVRFRL